jgi:pimeloyl-ACP methyl ester carboxylesterase
MEGLDSEVLELIEVKGKEGWKEYIDRYEALIDSKEDFILIGTSLGGMISIELAKRLQPQMVILISSLKSGKELPTWMKILRFIPLHRLIPGKWLLVSHIWHFKWLRKTSRTKKLDLMIDMAEKTLPGFVAWTAKRVVAWRSQAFPQRLIHIHGDRDRLFPIRHIDNPEVIKGGSHVMVLYRSNEIAKRIKEAIAEIHKEK